MATSSKYKYSVEQANRAFPLVKAIVQDLASVAKSVEGASQRLEILTDGRSLNQCDPYDEELSEMKRAIDRDTERVNEFIAELNKLSITVEPDRHDAVAFPADMDGRRICLVWQLGEPEVLTWREEGASFDERQPLVVGSSAVSEPATSEDEL